jgi:farnesyl diphosphate synthase
VACFGREIGLAFQIVDDILDVEGTSADLGKTAGKDAAAGKPTYPALFGLAASRRLAREAADRATARLIAAGLASGNRLAQIAEWVVARRT